MNRQEIYIEIEELRSKLTAEYEKCIDKAGVNTEVIALSHKLDQLILQYMKICISE